MFWISKGPSFGVLTIINDINNYLDFSDVNFQYNKCLYIKEYDLYYPKDLTVTGRLDDKKIKLHVWSVFDGYEYIFKFPGKNFYKAIIIPEMPARMNGFYQDKNQTIDLKGDCKLVPQRQSTMFGHNSFKVDFLKPPKGVGISFDLNSHYFKKQIISKIQLAPRPKLKMDIKKIDLLKIKREKN
jgi:hypothetical protein